MYQSRESFRAASLPFLIWWRRVDAATPRSSAASGTVCMGRTYTRRVRGVNPQPLYLRGKRKKPSPGHFRERANQVSGVRLLPARPVELDVVRERRTLGLGRPAPFDRIVDRPLERHEDRLREAVAVGVADLVQDGEGSRRPGVEQGDPGHVVLRYVDHAAVGEVISEGGGRDAIVRPNAANLVLGEAPEEAEPLEVEGAGVRAVAAVAARHEGWLAEIHR